MRVYRAFERKHEATAFTGEGARIYGGRWNSAGTTVVYTSSSFALALLEIMTNASSLRIPVDMVYAPIEIPDELPLDVLDVAALPQDWFKYPARECQLAGDAWAQRAETVGLVVSSGVARIETNVLLNPAHADFSRIRVGDIAAMAIDDRLVR
ncbi:MAG TPA: RES domain-containing protein [Candidatus Cybelea sp.]